MDEKHGPDGDGKADAPAGTAPAKKPWNKPRIEESTGTLYQVLSGLTPWSQVYEDVDYHPES